MTETEKFLVYIVGYDFLTLILIIYSFCFMKNLSFSFQKLKRADLFVFFVVAFFFSLKKFEFISLFLVIFIIIFIILLLKLLLLTIYLKI